MFVCVCVRACMRACVRACVCVSVHVCVDVYCIQSAFEQLQQCKYLSTCLLLLLLVVVLTRRVPVQRAVERDEIPYPYKVHDTTLRPLLNITIQKHNLLLTYISRIY